MPELHLTTDYQSAQRFPAWIALTVFSAICLAADETQYNRDNVTAADRWVWSVCLISTALSLIAVLFYLGARHLFMATPLEIGTTVILLIFWCSGLPVLMNPNRNIAADENGIKNANLYFGAWASLFSLIYVAASLSRDVFGIQMTDVASTNVIKWYLLSTTSVIVMASAARFFNVRDCSNPYETYFENCKRTKFAIAVGALSFVASFVVAYWVQMGLGFNFEFGATILLFVLWCFGVGFITFGESPGANIGNLYFGCWFSFLIIVALFTDSFRAFLAPQGAEQNNTNREGDVGHSEPTPTPEVPFEEDI